MNYTTIPEIDNSAIGKEDFMSELLFMWQHDCPQWRFGQLIYNFLRHTNRDIFYCTDKEFLNKLEEYIVTYVKPL